MTITSNNTLKLVETVEFTRTKQKSMQNGSDSKSTYRTIDSNSLSLGHLAPGALSEVKIISLSVPYTLGINNIKIGLISAGDIIFANNIFGVGTLGYLDYNYKPLSYFQGVNGDKLSDSIYNIEIANNGRTKSQYVYLNMSLPSNYAFVGDTIRFKWFFDYVSSSSIQSIESTITTGTSIMYPYYATTSNITAITQQPLPTKGFAYVQTEMVKESGVNKQTADFPVSWGSIKGVQFYNTFSEQWEWIIGDKTNSLSTFSQSSTTHLIKGALVNYKRFIHNGSLTGARSLRWYIT
jgi:hypothetical protein